MRQDVVLTELALLHRLPFYAASDRLEDRGWRLAAEWVRQTGLLPPIGVDLTYQFPRTGDGPGVTIDQSCVQEETWYGSGYGHGDGDGNGRGDDNRCGLITGIGDGHGNGNFMGGDISLWFGDGSGDAPGGGDGWGNGEGNANTEGTPDSVESVERLVSQLEEPMIQPGEYVIVRSRDCGVMCGEYVYHNGREVCLQSARHIWSWRGGRLSLLDVAMTPGMVQLSTTSSKPVVMLEACAIFPVSKEVETVLRTAPPETFSDK